MYQTWNLIYNNLTFRVFYLTLYVCTYVFLLRQKSLDMIVETNLPHSEMGVS
jgi:hypothetical protein